MEKRVKQKRSKFESDCYTLKATYGLMTLADEYSKEVIDKLQSANITDVIFVQEILSILDINVVRYCVSLVLIVLIVRQFSNILNKDRNSKKLINEAIDPCQFKALCDLAKTSFTPEQTETVTNIVLKHNVDVNIPVSYSGLTLFLCSCLSGNKKLINFMLSKGGNISSTTSAGDTALYLATFAVIHSGNSDGSVLEDLILAGCNVNKANAGGYTPLHRAAGGGNIQIIKLLLKYGASPYKFSVEGIYPVDIAVNNGYLEAAELLQIRVYNPHVWDVIEPHTPPRIKMGLQSPKKNHLIESSRQFYSPKLTGKV